MCDNWNIECSDDECEVKNGVYEPPAEQIEKFYTLLTDGKYPELEWQSPGYRSPTPTNTPQMPVEEEKQHAEEKSDFDFMDDIGAPKLPVVLREGEATLKGSAKKKTTSLDGVLSNMRRHRRLELQMLDSQQPPTTTT